MFSLKNQGSKRSASNHGRVSIWPRKNSMGQSYMVEEFAWKLLKTVQERSAVTRYSLSDTVVLEVSGKLKLTVLSIQFHFLTYISSITAHRSLCESLKVDLAVDPDLRLDLDPEVRVPITRIDPGPLAPDPAHLRADPAQEADREVEPGVELRKDRRKIEDREHQNARRRRQRKGTLNTKSDFWSKFSDERELDREADQTTKNERKNEKKYTESISRKIYMSLSSKAKVWIILECCAFQGELCRSLIVRKMNTFQCLAYRQSQWEKSPRQVQFQRSSTKLKDKFLKMQQDTRPFW